MDRRWNGWFFMTVMEVHAVLRRDGTLSCWSKLLQFRRCESRRVCECLCLLVCDVQSENVHLLDGNVKVQMSTWVKSTKVESRNLHVHCIYTMSIGLKECVLRQFTLVIFIHVDICTLTMSMSCSFYRTDWVPTTRDIHHGLLSLVDPIILKIAVYRAL